MGGTGFNPDDVDVNAEGFIAYADLSEATAISWAQNKAWLNDDGDETSLKEMIESGLAAELYRMSTGPLTSGVPW